MAISPTVNAYMQGQQQQAPTSADAAFSKTFTDQSYNLLQAKFATLANAVITFKVLDMDIEKGNALGAFIIRYGDDVRYIPTVMSNGNMVSCEMVYNKKEDTMAPLTDDVVKELANKSIEKNHQLLSNDVKVEDTRQLFRNMIRPPKSSSPLLASTSLDIADLPNNCKDQLYEHFTENPSLLAKVAEFYPVQHLATKLQHNEESPSAPSSEVVRLDTLTKEAASFLNEWERKRILDKGYIVKTAQETDTILVDKKNIQKSFEEEYEAVDLKEYCMERCNCYKFRMNPYGDKLCTDPVLLADVLCMGGDKFYWEPVVITQKQMVFRNRYVSDLLGVAKNIRPLRDPEDAVEFGLVSSLREAVNKTKFGRITAVFPTKSGEFKCITGISLNSDPRVSEHEGSTTVSTCCGSLTETPMLTYGCWQSNGDVIVPKRSYYLVREYNDDSATRHPLVHSLDQFVRLMLHTGISVKINNDGVTTSVTDNKTEKTASFTSTGGVAEHLHDMYKLSEEQIDKALELKDFLVFGKTADLLPQGNMQQPAQQPIMQQGQPQFAPQQLQDFAELQDPEVMDVGMLSSFARNPDIKAMLVDYLPDFVNVLDRIGRIILLFNIDKTNLEKFYGVDKFSTLLSSCRRVFKTVGELTFDLKKYINMV